MFGRERKSGRRSTPAGKARGIILVVESLLAAEAVGETTIYDGCSAHGKQTRATAVREYRSSEA